MLEYLGKKEKGFTLMELLIAVAIVVILAGVGIPVYLKFMTGAKVAEASTNLAGIKLAEEGYKLANGVYLTCSVEPRDAPNQDPVPWVDRTGNFDAIDFSVGGDVRFVYEVTAVNALGVNSFEVGAQGDTDGDGTLILFTCTNTTSPAATGDVGYTGTLTGGTGD